VVHCRWGSPPELECGRRISSYARAEHVLGGCSVGLACLLRQCWKSWRETPTFELAYQTTEAGRPLSFRLYSSASGVSVYGLAFPSRSAWISSRFGGGGETRRQQKKQRNVSVGKEEHIGIGIRHADHIETCAESVSVCHPSHCFGSHAIS